MFVRMFVWNTAIPNNMKKKHYNDKTANKGKCSVLYDSTIRDRCITSNYDNSDDSAQIPSINSFHIIYVPTRYCLRRKVFTQT